MDQKLDNTTTEVFDRHGDLKLIVWKNHSMITFQVCSRTLARSSPVWDVMLYGPFREGKAQQKGDEWTVSLPEDDADGLRIILSTIHGIFDAVPTDTKLHFDSIFSLVALSDKYDMVAALKPSWKSWLCSWGCRITSETNRFSFLHRGSAHRVVQYLWLCYTVGWGDQFRSGLCTLMQRTGLGNDGRPRVTAGDSEDPEADDIYLDSSEYLGFINTSTIEEILEARLRLLETMLTKIRDVMTSLRSSSTATRVCKADEKGAGFCDRTLFNALRQAMVAVKVEHWYRGRKGTASLAKTLTLSVQQMEYDILDKIKSHANATLQKRVRYQRSTHAKCWPEDHLQVFEKWLPEDDTLARINMEQLDIFGNPTDSDSDRPVKRHGTELLLRQLDPLNSAASSADPVFPERERLPAQVISSNTSNGYSSSFYKQWFSIDVLTSDTTAAQPRPTPPTTSNDVLADDTPVLDLISAARILLAKRDKTTSKEAENTVGQEPKQENTTAATQARTEEGSAVNAHIESFDDHGDLTLIVGEAQANFLVCSYSLRRVSATWYDRLYGSHSDPQDREGEHPWTICLPDDDPDAMRIILRVVHGNLSEMPAVLSMDMLCHLTATCDRHDMMGLLKPCWSGWVQKLPKQAFDPATFAQQIWIAYKLGHLAWYRGTLAAFLCNTQKSPEGKLFSETDPEIDFYNNPYLQELGLLNDWEDGRVKIIEVVGNILREALNRLSNPQAISCNSGKAQDNCDCAMLGGVHRALYGRNWYSGGAPSWEKDVTISVHTLVTKVEGIRTAAIGESRMKRKDHAHKRCTPWVSFTLLDVLRVCPVYRAVSIDTAAFQEQAKKTGLDVQLKSALGRPGNGPMMGGFWFVRLGFIVGRFRCRPIGVDHLATFCSLRNVCYYVGYTVLLRWNALSRPCFPFSTAPIVYPTTNRDHS
ncbi:hypothetical protein F5144DRAFT_525097 [Chaetomium tenue]|uniref:Uncharacterized protein n=1 Tax=Chaetomium tenue TaxID=1854479 RepID=A0ACB7PT72_9PEZI|nr:hypothetical protein F5144DRAFT_525097 [Chaetomium globosum]